MLNEPDALEFCANEDAGPSSPGSYILQIYLAEPPTLSKQSCFLITGTGQAATGSNGCNPALVATLSWNTSLSGLK